MPLPLTEVEVGFILSIPHEKGGPEASELRKLFERRIRNKQTITAERELR
jgi:hypothetical protein